MLITPLKIGIDYGTLFGGVSVIQSPHCTEEKWNFPPSRHRSKRLHKKLTKRLGPQRVRVPAMFKMLQNGREVFVAHPDIFAKLKAETARQIETEILGGIGVNAASSEPLTPFKLRQALLKMRESVDDCGCRGDVHFCGKIS